MPPRAKRPRTEIDHADGQLINFNLDTGVHSLSKEGMKSFVSLNSKTQTQRDLDLLETFYDQINDQLTNQITLGIGSLRAELRTEREQHSINKRDLETLADCKDELERVKTNLTVANGLNAQLQLKAADTERVKQFWSDLSTKLSTALVAMTEQSDQSMQLLIGGYNDLSKQFLDSTEVKIRHEEEKEQRYRLELEKHIAERKALEEEKERWERERLGWEQRETQWEKDKEKFISTGKLLREELNLSKASHIDDQASLQEQEKEIKILNCRADELEKQSESRCRQLQGQLRQLEDEKQVITEDKRRTQQKNRELEESCSEKNRIIQQLSDSSAQIKVNQAAIADHSAQIRETQAAMDRMLNNANRKQSGISTSSNTIDGSPPTDPFNLPQSPAQREMCDVENLTLINFTEGTVSGATDKVLVSPDETEFVFKPITKIAWDDCRLTSVSDLVGCLPKYWHGVLESKNLKCWEEGVYSHSMLNCLLEAISLGLPAHHASLLFIDYYAEGLTIMNATHTIHLLLGKRCELCWSAFDPDEPPRSIKLKSSGSDRLLNRALGIRYVMEMVKNPYRKLDNFDEIPRPDMRPLSEQEKWDNFQLFRQAALWTAACRLKESLEEDGEAANESEKELYTTLQNEIQYMISLAV